MPPQGPGAAAAGWLLWLLYGLHFSSSAFLNAPNHPGCLDYQQLGVIQRCSYDAECFSKELTDWFTPAHYDLWLMGFRQCRWELSVSCSRNHNLQRGDVSESKAGCDSGVPGYTATVLVISRCFRSATCKALWCVVGVFLFQMRHQVFPGRELRRANPTKTFIFSNKELVTPRPRRNVSHDRQGL